MKYPDSFEDLSVHFKTAKPVPAVAARFAGGDGTVTTVTPIVFDAASVAPPLSVTVNVTVNCPAPV